MLSISALALLAAAVPPPEKPAGAPPPVVRPAPTPPEAGQAPPRPSLGPTRGVVPAGARSALPAIPLQSLVSMADYPAVALANRDEGRTAFRLAVGANGRVSGCVILVSSGSSALDSATCQVVVRRARFSPATDSAGQPVADQYFGEIRWRIER